MPKVQINIDRDQEMLEIVVNGECFFCGNYWDFSTPRDLLNLLVLVGDVELNRNWRYEE